MFKPAFRFLAVVAWVVFGAMVAHPASAQTKSLEWLAIDTDITVLSNGDLQIKETNQIRFVGGAFTFGYRDIDTSRLTGVSNVRVTENGQSLRIETGRTDEGKFRIKYYFTPAQNQERTFVLDYLVRGATRYYDAGDQVYWAGVYAERNGYSVRNAKITVNLPAGATAQLAAAYGPQAEVSGQGEGRVVATAKESIPSGQEFEVRVQFPHGVITGSAPAWQRGFDSQRQYEETTKPVVDLGFLGLALVLLFGGPAGVIALYNAKGKDPNVGLVAEYLSEPPDITPGIAGTLIDERADMQDVIATLVDLARRGVITMQEDAPDKTFGFSSQNYTFSRGPQFGQSGLHDYEQKLIDAIGLNGGDSVELKNLRNKFYAKIPGLKKALYAGLQKDGLYNHNPESVRSQYAGLGVLLLVLAAVSVCASFFMLALSEWALCLPVGLGVTGIFMLIFAPKMPLRTRKGADLHMRAQAFKRYLQNIEKYGSLEDAKERFDTFLPFAIAYGLERTFVAKFAKVDAPIPPWYVPYGPVVIHSGPYGYPGGGIGAGGGASRQKSMPGAPDIGGAASAPGQGGLSGLDKSLTGGLAAMSANLTGMFTSVSTAFNSVPAPKVSGTGSTWKSGGSWSGWSSGSSGGWSGGGGGGGGSSGGGGGGFG